MVEFKIFRQIEDRKPRCIVTYRGTDDKTWLEAVMENRLRASNAFWSGEWTTKETPHGKVEGILWLSWNDKKERFDYLLQTYPKQVTDKEIELLALASLSNGEST